MSPSLKALAEVVQEDAGGRGLRADPHDNLITACPHDLLSACNSLARCASPRVLILTGFYIPSATPAAAETDGPLGAVFLARALVPLGFEVSLASEAWCLPALQAGLNACGLGDRVPLIRLPEGPGTDWAPALARTAGQITHLISIERVGPSHTPASLRRQGANERTMAEYAALADPEHHDRCHNMRGRDISAWTSPAHVLFESDLWPTRPETIGIGDGGNEIGMGKVPWETIRRNIPGGGLIACRVPVDHLIVAGVSNWGGYALAAGVLHLRGKVRAELFDPAHEEAVLERMVRQGPLVDGKTGMQEATVDGLPFARHAQVLQELGRIVKDH